MITVEGTMWPKRRCVIFIIICCIILWALLIAMSKALASDISTVQQVQETVLSHMVYQLTPQSSPDWKGEMATPCPLFGDCKNFALCKCAMLHERGIDCIVAIYGYKPAHAVAVIPRLHVYMDWEGVLPWRGHKGGWWVRTPDWQHHRAPVTSVHGELNGQKLEQP